jgi:hypothetical protein
MRYGAGAVCHRLQVAKLKTELEGYEAEAMVQEAKKDSSLQVSEERRPG